MYIEKKRGPKNGAMVLDVLHVALGLMIVVLGVLTFLNPEGHMFFFPVIFFLGGVLKLADGVYARRLAARGRKNKRAGWAALTVGALLLILTVLSALSIWR